MERKMDGKDIIWIKDGHEIVRLHGKAESNCLVFSVTGSLNEQSEIDFRQELMALASGGMDVIVDLKETIRLTGGSMGALLDAAHVSEMLGCRLCIRNPSEEIVRQLEYTHIDKAIEIVKGDSAK